MATDLRIEVESTFGQIVMTAEQSTAHPGKRAFGMRSTVVLIVPREGLRDQRVEIAHYDAPTFAHAHAAQLRHALDWTWRDAEKGG